MSPKAQTTREQMTGVYTFDNTQLVFLDTPGVISLENTKVYVIYLLIHLLL